MDENPRSEFDQAMLGIYTRALKEAGYNAHLYLQMLHDHGGEGTAHRLLATREDVQYGFTELYLKGRLDLTVEYLVLDSRWHVLIDESERAVARERLLAHDFPRSELPS